jgi:hypothetical protein
MFQTIYDVACPYCGADVDKWCQVVAGKPANVGRPLPYPHEARRLAYRVAKAGEPVRPAP